VGRHLFRWTCEGLEASQNLAGVDVLDAKEFMAGGLTTGEDDAGLGEAQEVCQEETAGRVGRALHRWRAQSDGEAFRRLCQELVAGRARLHLDCQQDVRAILGNGGLIGPHA
jgi:hypothetical protein